MTSKIEPRESSSIFHGWMIDSKLIHGKFMTSLQQNVFDLKCWRKQSPNYIILRCSHCLYKVCYATNPAKHARSKISRTFMTDDFLQNQLNRRLKTFYCKNCNFKNVIRRAVIHVYIQWQLTCRLNVTNNNIHLIHLVMSSSDLYLRNSKRIIVWVSFWEKVISQGTKENCKYWSTMLFD